MDVDFRLKSYEAFKKMPLQTWGQLSEINFDDLIYAKEHLISQLEAGMKCTKERSRKPLKVGSQSGESHLHLAGAAAQYESEVVYIL